MLPIGVACETGTSLKAGCRCRDALMPWSTPHVSRTNSTAWATSRRLVFHDRPLQGRYCIYELRVQAQGNQKYNIACIMLQMFGAELQARRLAVTQYLISRFFLLSAANWCHWSLKPPSSSGFLATARGVSFRCTMSFAPWALPTAKVSLLVTVV